MPLESALTSLIFALLGAAAPFAPAVVPAPVDALAPPAPVALPSPDGRPPQAIARVDTDEPVVALTFDACATNHQANGFDRAVFRILQAERVPVTVFLSGRWIEFHPAEARELAAQPWVELGNHAHRHPKLSSLSADEIAREIDRTEAAIQGLGRRSVGLRPPFGDWDAQVAQVAASKNLPLVLWDVVSGDAGGHLSAAHVIDNVTRRTRRGSIVIFHINGRGPHTAQALPTVLRTLRARGLRFVSISTLLAGPHTRRVAARPMRYIKRSAGDRKG